MVSWTFIKKKLADFRLSFWKSITKYSLYGKYILHLHQQQYPCSSQDYGYHYSSQNYTTSYSGKRAIYCTCCTFYTCGIIIIKKKPFLGFDTKVSPKVLRPTVHPSHNFILHVESLSMNYWILKSVNLARPMKTYAHGY